MSLEAYAAQEGLRRLREWDWGLVLEEWEDWEKEGLLGLFLGRVMIRPTTRLNGVKGFNTSGDMTTPVKEG